MGNKNEDQQDYEKGRNAGRRGDPHTFLIDYFFESDAERRGRQEGESERKMHLDAAREADKKK